MYEKLISSHTFRCFHAHVSYLVKQDLLQTYGCPLSDKCSRWEYFFNKHVECCESVR